MLQINTLEDIIIKSENADKEIEESNYNDKYIESYLISNKVSLFDINNVILQTKGIINILNNSYIYGENIYKMLNGYKFNDIIELHIYFKSESDKNLIIKTFDNFIVEQTDSKIFILYSNIQLILHIKTIYTSILNLLICKKNKKYNLTLIDNTLYYYPVSYFILKYNDMPINNSIYTMNEIENVIQQINTTCTENNIISIIQENNSLKDLYISLILIQKQFNLFKQILHLIPLNWFTTNYIIFEMIDHGYITFFKIITEYEQQNNIIFNFNTLNKDGLLPQEYCLYKFKMLFSSANDTHKIKIHNIFKLILQCLMNNRSKHCMLNCECTCNCTCHDTGDACTCTCACKCNNNCFCHINCIQNKNIKHNACLCSYINNCMYSRNIIFFDAILETNMFNVNNSFDVNKLIIEEAQELIKSNNKQRIVQIESNNDVVYSSECSKYLKNTLILSMKKINSSYLNIYYRMINSDKSIISIDDIITFIKFNKNFISIQSIMQICKAYKSEFILMNLLKENILSISNYNVLIALFDLNYYSIIIKQNDYENIIKKYIKNILIHLVDTLNIKGLEFINTIDKNYYLERINNNNDTILHYLISKEIKNDNDLILLLGIFEDIFYMYQPDLLNMTNNDNETCLFNCIKTNNKETFKILLDFDIDLSILNNNGQTIIHELILNECTDLLDVLLSNIIDNNAKEDEKNKICCTKSKKEFKEHLNNLLVVKNKNDEIPIITAFKRRNINIILKLLTIKNDYDQNIIQKYISLYNIPIIYNKNKKINNDVYKKYMLINSFINTIKK